MVLCESPSARDRMVHPARAKKKGLLGGLAHFWAAGHALGRLRPV